MCRNFCTIRSCMSALCPIIPVSGKYTERDIYLYYQENEKEGVRELLDIIKENAASTTKADRALGF